VTPEKWLEKLTTEHQKRRKRLEMFDAYYRGEQPLAFATREFLEAFGGLFGAFADNWCETVVNAVNEYGAASVMRIHNVEILNHGTGMSIDDIMIDETMTFTCTNIVPWQPKQYIAPHLTA
jgi:hypothetical protein